MDPNQLLIVAVAGVPTMLTVLIGILLNNGRFSDLNLRMTAMEGRLNCMDGRLAHMDSKLDSRFDMVIRRIEEFDNRLTRIEGQLH